MDNNQLSTPPPAARTFKNRRGLLIAFGVFQLLIAAVMFMFAALMLFIPTSEIAKSQPPGAPQFPLALISIFYAAIGVLFATLGIGSILAKNWARIGTLVVSWFWLGIGIISFLFSALLMPSILKNVSYPQQNLPPHFERTVLIASLVMTGTLFVLLPGIFLIVYHGKNVKATCLAGRSANESAGRPVLMTVLIFLFGFSLLSIP